MELAEFLTPITAQDVLEVYQLGHASVGPAQVYRNPIEA
jgi:hypothetical protein